ncbi:DUF3618 domain-containing protein [soil metagenome]
MDRKQDEVENQGLENSSSEEIRQDIRGTRRGMDNTLNELGDRLHPRNLLDEVFDIFRGGGSDNKLARTSKDVVRTVGRELRERPLPALLVGAGLAWWIYDMASEDDDPHRYRPRRDGDSRPFPTSRSFVGEEERRNGGDGGNGPYLGSEATVFGNEALGASGRDESILGQAGDKIKEAAATVGDKLEDATSAVGDKVRRGGSAARSAADLRWRRGTGAVQDYTERGKRAVRQQAGILQERFEEASDEYPLAMGGAFLAAGLLAGLLLPRSEREDEWMGEASDQIKEEARAVGEEALEKGKAAAAETAASAMDEAEARGITPETVAEKAGRAVSETVKAGRESAEGKGDPAAGTQEESKKAARRRPANEGSPSTEEATEPAEDDGAIRLT